MRLIASYCGLLAAVLLGGCVIAPGDYPQGTYQGSPGYQGYQPDSPSQPVNYSGSVDEVDQPPPPIPDDDQPPCPEDGFLWTPGVWQWGPAGYFWVPGTWVAPPSPGLLWTPAYWALSGAVYVYHPGYWGQHIGFYGGINYGHGYFGDGYAGGRWVNNEFHYNHAVTSVNVSVVHNVYNETVVNNFNSNRVSFAGGAGTRLQPNPHELSAAHEGHIPPTVVQIRHESAARGAPQQAASRSFAQPPVGRTYAQPDQVQHARDLPRPQGLPAQSTGANPYADVQARHEQERQALALQQEQEHRAFANQPNHGAEAYQQLEQRHQQETQQLQQRQQQEKAAVSRPQGRDDREKREDHRN